MLKLVKLVSLMVALAGLLHGCAVSEPIPERTVVVDMEPGGLLGNDYVAEAFTIERLLPLKASGLASVRKIDMRYGRLFVRDGRAHRLWVFSMDGDSLLCIDKRGRAANEYMGISDFAIGDNGDIAIYDASSAKLIHYDLKGNYKSHVRLAYADGFLQRRNGNVALLYNRAGNVALAEYGPDGKKLRQAEGEVAKAPLSLSYLGGMAEQGDTVLFTVPFDHTVYALAGESVTPKYKMEFPGHGIPEELWTDDKQAALRRLGSTGGVLYVDQMALCGRNLFMSTNKNTPIIYGIDRNEARAIGNLKLPFSVLYSGKLFVAHDGHVLSAISYGNLKNGLCPVLGDYLEAMPCLAPLNDFALHGDCYWVVVARVNGESLWR